MKTQFLKLIQFMSKNKLVEKLAIIFYHEISKSKQYEIESKIVTKLGKDLSLEVQSGPFIGLKYPDLKSFGSVIFPKLLGCYEKELHPIIDKIKKLEVDVVYDIGAAEGYYAIGMAKIFPNAIIKAIDTSDLALKLCSNLIQLNNISNIQLLNSISTDELKADSAKRLLIISDCEGYELDFFLGIDPWVLKNAVLLIETHDHINYKLSKKLKDHFAATHQIQSIFSIDDIKKMGYPELDKFYLLSQEEKSYIISERRGYQQEWIYLTPKV